jgi:hypothetical protein
VVVVGAWGPYTVSTILVAMASSELVLVIEC